MNEFMKSEQNIQISPEEYLNFIDAKFYEKTEKIFKIFEILPSRINEQFGKNTKLQIKINNDTGISTSTVLDEIIIISSGLIRHCLEVEHPNVDSIIKDFPLQHEEEEIVIPQMMIGWIVAREIFHGIRKHSQVIEKLGNSADNILAQEFDADLCAATEIYRLLQEIFIKKQIPDIHIRLFCFYCLFWGMRRLPDEKSEIRLTKAQKYLAILFKLTELSRSLKGDPDFTYRKEILNPLLATFKSCEDFFQNSYNHKYNLPNVYDEARIANEKMELARVVHAFQEMSATIEEISNTRASNKDVLVSIYVEMSNEEKKLIADADDYARKKKYSCLHPGCDRVSVDCHSVPKSSLIDGLARGGKLYSRPASFAFWLKEGYQGLLKFDLLGINKVSIFKGYCSIHDNKNFEDADNQKVNTKNYYEGLQLRAISFTYCRERYVRDVLSYFARHAATEEIREHFKNEQEKVESNLHLYKTVYLAEMFNIMKNVGRNSLFFIKKQLIYPLGVSCSGLFFTDYDNNESKSTAALNSGITYSVFSYKFGTTVVLSSFDAFKDNLVKYYNGFTGDNAINQLINDIVFRRSVEPFFGVKLYESLSDYTKDKIDDSFRSSSKWAAEGFLEIVSFIPKELIDPRII